MNRTARGLPCFDDDQRVYVDSMNDAHALVTDLDGDLTFAHAIGSADRWKLEAAYAQGVVQTRPGSVMTWADTNDPTKKAWPAWPCQTCVARIEARASRTGVKG